MTYEEMGKTLGLTERTIRYHMGEIIQRLHVENRSQVIAYAARMGLTGNHNKGSE
jgi:two-component system NarL family response regulator